MLKIHEANPEDVPLILSFIRELAEYEREPNAVRATEDDLRRDGFSANPKFRVIIAESDGNPAGMAFFFHHYSTWQGRQGLLATVRIASNAFPKSSIKSSVASTPIDTRISPSVIPSLFLSSGDIPECEVAAGLVSRLSTPPRLTVMIGIEAFFMNCSAAVLPPLGSKLSIPLNPSNNSPARLCCGWLMSPG